MERRSHICLSIMFLYTEVRVSQGFIWDQWSFTLMWWEIDEQKILIQPMRDSKASTRWYHRRSGWGRGGWGSKRFGSEILFCLKIVQFQLCQNPFDLLNYFCSWKYFGEKNFGSKNFLGLKNFGGLRGHKSRKHYKCKWYYFPCEIVNEMKIHKMEQHTLKYRPAKSAENKML